MSKRTNRKQILSEIVSNGVFPISISSSNIELDHIMFSRLLLEWKISNMIGISKETDRNIIWFWRKKEKR